ncbi:hypothetical protein GJAV_G00199440 [Gymnothorax javanicus]|nr:hypothetical protein GJAV_G00199440 [Gymnothorax javanicus]
MLLAALAVSLHITTSKSQVKGISPLSFTHHLYNATIYENSAPRTYVESPIKMGVVVTDEFWDIKYKLVAGDDDNLFKTEEVTVGDFCFLRIKTRTGESAVLNREVRDSYTLTVEASESTYDYQARTKVLIQVLDTNDLKPLFYPASYNVFIREDTPLKTSVVQVTATDADISSNADFYYTFISRSHPFAVDPVTGTITLTKKLDHSRARRYELTVLAEDRTKKISGIRKFGNEAKVIVNVEKVTPEPPIIKSVNIITPKDDDDMLSLNVAVKAGVKAVESLKIVAGDPQRNLAVIPSSLEGYNFEVVSTKRIDWLHSPFGLNISLQAKDRSNPPILSMTKEIFISPIKHAHMKFNNEVYRVTLSEFSPPNCHVLHVMVMPNHANVTYRIKNRPKSFKFKINPRSGLVSTTEHVDFEKKSRYEFDVVANQGEAQAHVVVDIIDENDNAPKFTSPSYQGTVPENVPIGTSILTVTAKDGDTGNNGFVTYAIANAGPLPFTVDPFTGVISTSEEMDYELMQRWYHVRVWATDSGKPFSHVSECAVSLIMSNVDDNVPVFERVGCNATIPQDFSVGESIGIMTAIDIDELQQVRYSIESGNERALFNIDPVSGSILLAKKIPSSLLSGEKSSFSLRIAATDGIHSAAPTVVSITLTDSSSDATMQCHEAGVFKQLTKKLIESIKPDMTTEEEEAYSDIHIINRHAPRFKSDLPSSMDLREDFPLNTTILHYQATDVDTGFNGKLVYAISSGNEDGCFTIDMETGELKLICPLDRETRAFYVLNITVYDLGVPQSSAWKFLALNVLDANDNAPIFDQSIYVISIPENTEVDKSIFKVHAVDYDLDDNGSIKYSLLTSTETFKIDELTGVLKVGGQLDRERNPKHDLKIQARDQAEVDHQLLTIVDMVVVLEDINDSPPKFVPRVYKIQVPEDVPLGTVLLWVESYDLDFGAGGEISYNLKNTQNGAFFLDTSTGCLTLEKELDFERTQFYNLTVRAVDHGLPRSLSSSCFIEVEVLDVNENLNAPAFSSFVYKAAVMENAAVGTSVVTLSAVDKDLGKDGVVRYHIHAGTGLGMFTIDEETGVIRTTETLDREANSRYWLTVYATDLGTIPLVSWTEVFIEVMDINDNPPELSQPIYFGSVLENSPKGKSVLKVAATDVDLDSEGKLTFQIVDTQRVFSINTKTGVIATKAVLDREQKAEHIIEVIVSDNGSPALSSTGTVVIQVLDENDNSPQFNHKLFQVKLPERHGVTEPQEVYRMVVRDDDEGPNAEVTFSLENDAENKFNIHPMTGVVTSKGAFGRGDYTILTIKATDHGSPARMSTARLDIEWIQKPAATSETVAFDEPHFNFAVMEMDPVNHMVGIISTDRMGSLLWFDIIGGDDELDFDIEKDTGTILIARRLDAGKRSNYNLTVRVTDGSQIITTQAYIRVVDMNGHRPMFLKSQYTVRVPEDTAPWKEILQISAEDKDINSRLLYTVHSSVHPESIRLFQLDPNSGVLVIKEELDFETLPVHTLILMVRDQEIPMKRNFVKAVINVEDCNDHSPVFMSSRYEANVLNLAAVGTTVLQTKALDKDTGSNAEIIYSFHSGNADGAFSIDPHTGDIKVAKPLDSLPQELYRLNVKATDQGFPQRSDISPVNIHVKLSDETPPKLSSDEYFTEISESTPEGSAFFTVTASGPSAVHYKIKSGNPNGTFHINQVSGVLSVQKALNFEERFSYQLHIRVVSMAGSYSDAVVHIYVIDENDNAPVFLQEEFVGVPFDREKQDEYDVAVEVRDFRSPPRIDLARIRVYVNDANDNAPEFLNLPQTIMISDEAEPGDVLFQVTATDKDLGENGSIKYRLEDDFDLFRVDPYLGDVSLQRPLDYESKNRYVLSVVAKDEGTPSLTSVADLHIHVRNRSNPIFQSLRYPLRVPENISPFTTILHVQAKNPEGYRLIYNLIEEPSSRYFHIDFKTGVLSVTDNLDYEAQSKHVLTVRATDSVTGAFSDATVDIEVEDINDNAPEFQQLRYTANVLEGLPVGTSVLQISATDKDSGRNKAITYQLTGTGKNETHFFEIDPESGLLVTTQELDYEDIQQFRLIVKAIDNGVPPMTSEAFITVNVTDVNDNPPKFSKEQYHATLNEMATCGHIVIRIQASDPDSTDLDKLGYTIISGNEDRHFSINKSSGLISFSNVCKKTLDPFYNLTVAVSDGVFQNTAPVNIDMMNSNRHSPHFDQSIYEAELAENAEAGTRVIRLAAIDPDDGPYGSVDYTIINKLADEKFKIDNKGQIITSQPLDRENPTQKVISIKVMAKDGGGRVGFCTVKIILTDENDNAPQFKASEYQVSIQSSVNKGSPVIQIMAYDADDGNNADVTYTVDEAAEVTEDVIEINPFTGVISTKESLVGMENKIFNFKIKAQDGGIPFYNSTVPVQVKVVSPKVSLPRFSEPLYAFSAAEDIPLGSEIGVVRADADTPIIYSLVNGNTVESNKEQVFGVDKDTGALFVQKDIDYEKTKWYQIDVSANCNRNGTDVASLVSVSIQVQDVNDNEPMFEANPYQAFVAENMPPGTTVIQVTANDPDMENNGNVAYRLEPDPDDISEVFNIDSETGWITTLKEIDCETTRLYRFHVVATDHGGKVKLSSSVLVEVTVTDENDNPPKFTEEVYQGSVIENSRPGDAIITLSIVDADVSEDNKRFTCYITEGDSQDQFSIAQVGEKWKLTLKSPLDREVKERYGLKIIATDGRYQDSATVDVHVLDINDNSPLCEQLLYTEVISENSPPGQFILKVSATDPDIGTNGQVSFTLHGPSADKFHLDPQTGELFTLAVLDREREVEYDLVAKATDGGGRSCQADVRLMVQDMNDNPPRFSTNHYEVTVFDNTTVRTPIAVIYAKDPDTGINSEVVYSLLGRDRRYFSLDEFSGILRLERSLSDEAQSRFELKVQATDRGLPYRRTSIATVTVSVVDLDDYQPVFLSSEYTAQIPESTTVGTEILSVSALAKDATDNVPITYDIISGNEHGKFKINSKTGALFVNRSLDFEHCREYYLSVEGTRGRSSLSDITMVVINITDVNDNAPAFSLGDYRKEISEDLSPGDAVMQVSAVDLDGPSNNVIHYSIVSGDPEHQFSIDPRSGEIRVSRSLDREEVTHYSLTVQAADSGHPPLSTAVQVTVTVSDVNDNPPLFSKVNHSVGLQEGDPVGSSVLQLIVTDRDTPRNGPPFSFHILSGNEDKRFHIDQGGLLSIAGPLRRRTKAQHLLKVQVTDSGHPPLSSICVVRINVTELSKYPPVVLPLEVFITTTEKSFSSRVIGKLHATDQDPHDVLTYRLGPDSPDGGQFSVDSTNGKITADRALEPGLYLLNVSVSDGRFRTWAGVRVHVWGATQQALDRGITLQLGDLTPEDFVTDHWRAMQRSLGAGLQVASLQQEPSSSHLEVLLVWRTAEPPPASRLARIMEDDMGVSVLRVQQGSCLGLDCPPWGCRNAVHVTGEGASRYSSARTGFITPQHGWESSCFCNESAVRFDGNGYLKFLYRTDSDEQTEQNFRLSLKIKTFQEHGLVMATNGSDWGALEVVSGGLRFKYGCGKAMPGVLRVQPGLVSDGRWHHVLLEVRGPILTLTLDRTHSNSVPLSEPCKLIRPGGALTFAAPWSPHGPGHSQGFRGCLGDMEFNGEPVRGTEGEYGVQSQLGRRRVFGLYQCCSQTERCADHPCQNGGTCEESSNGEFRCRCARQYFGSRCELPNNPCSSQPCRHGGVCYPKAQGYMCSCPEHATGSRCQNIIDACSPNPCPSGHDCKMSDGFMHCDPLPLVSGGIGVLEIVEIAASALGILFLVGVFVCVRKRYVQRKKQKSGTTRNSNGYYPACLAKRMMKDERDIPPIEMNMLAGSRNDLDNDPFRTLKPQGQTDLGSRGGGQPQKAQGPVVCSVAPNLPPPPPSSSDNESILKNNWELDYDVYPADPDYFGRPTVQEFPQFDIGEGTYSNASTVDPRRTARFGGFPFPLERNDRRAPLPPCYSNQDLDDFLGPDGQPLPTPPCHNEYTAISYYPTERTRSADNVSGGNYRRLSMRLSVAQPSFAEIPPPVQEAPDLPVQEPHSYAGSDMVESDYGSCEEVMF